MRLSGPLALQPAKYSPGQFKSINTEEASTWAIGSLEYAQQLKG
jgi:hypothetical protein